MISNFSCDKKGTREGKTKKSVLQYFIITTLTLLLSFAGGCKKQIEQNTKNTNPVVDIMQQKTKVLLVTESKNLENLKQLIQSMEKDGYFQNIMFCLEVSLPISYPGEQEDRKRILIEDRRLIGPLASTSPLETRRILFYNRFFNKDNSMQKAFLLHELAHQINYNSGIFDELYKRVSSIKNLDVISSDLRLKRSIERIANEEMTKILALPDEILAEKWLYKNWHDLFYVRIIDYLEADRKNLKELENNVSLNKAGKYVLQGIINRILLIKSFYSFYEGNSKIEHLALMRRLEDCIKHISIRNGFDGDFIFEYIDKIMFECTRKEINSEILAELFISYRKDFFKNVFDVQI